jgi:hypothetical protein
VMTREMCVVDRRGSRGGAAVSFDFDRALVVESADDDLVGALVVSDPHTVLHRAAGTEYWQWSKGGCPGSRRS